MNVVKLQDLKLGSQETPGITGTFGLRMWNEARQRLTEFSQENALVISNTFFQQHSSKASILQCSAFFTVQLSHPHMTTGKTIALTKRTLVSKVMSLLLNMLNQGKLEVVKQEMARVNIDILGISELKWT